MWKYIKKAGSWIKSNVMAFVVPAAVGLGVMAFEAQKVMADIPAPVGVDQDFNISTATLGIVMGACVLVAVGVLVYRKIMAALSGR